MHSFCLIAGTATAASTRARAAAALEMEQPPALKMRRSNAVQSRRLALRMGLLERHLAVLESERMRTVRQIHQELRHLYVPVRSVTLSPRHAQVLHDAGDDDLFEGTAHDAQGHDTREHDNHLLLHPDHHQNLQQHHGNNHKTHIYQDHYTVPGDAPRHGEVNVLRVHQAEAPLETIEGLPLIQNDKQESAGKTVEGSSQEGNAAATQEDKSKSQEVKDNGDELSPQNEKQKASETEEDGGGKRKGGLSLGWQESVLDTLRIDTTGGKSPRTLDITGGKGPVTRDANSRRGSTTFGANSRRGSSVFDTKPLTTLGGFAIPASTMKKRGLVRLGQRRGSGLFDSQGEVVELPVQGKGIASRSNTFVVPLRAVGGANAVPQGETGGEQLAKAEDKHNAHPPDTKCDEQQQQQQQGESDITLIPTGGPRQGLQDYDVVLPDLGTGDTSGPASLFMPPPPPTVSPRWAKKPDTKGKSAGRRYNRLCPLLPPPTAASTSAPHSYSYHHHHHHHQQHQQQHCCNHFPCTQPDTYHSLGFNPDTSTHTWKGWQVQNARRPHHRLDPHRPPDPLAYADGRCPTPGDAPGYMRRKRLGKEEVVRMDMARKKEAHAQARPPSWNTNYGQPVPYKRLKYPVRLNPLL